MPTNTGLYTCDLHGQVLEHHQWRIGHWEYDIELRRLVTKSIRFARFALCVFRHGLTCPSRANPGGTATGEQPWPPGSLGQELPSRPVVYLTRHSTASRVISPPHQIPVNGRRRQDQTGLQNPPMESDSLPLDPVVYTLQIIGSPLRPRSRPIDRADGPGL